MLQSAGLNVVFLAAGAGAFTVAFNSARQRGLLLRIGE
jgi:hypothetical protein